MFEFTFILHCESEMMPMCNVAGCQSYCRTAKTNERYLDNKLSSIDPVHYKNSNTSICKRSVQLFHSFTFDEV